MQNLTSKRFSGPKDISAVFFYRPNIADENTILATYHEDEYGFASMPPQFGDWMIDAGGYVGSTAILYAQLFPDSKVVCIEPLPENIEIIKKNIEANGLENRIVLMDRALWSSSTALIDVYYRDDSTVGAIHKFVGSAFPNYHETVSKDCHKAMSISLHALVQLLDMKRVRVLKMDIEGAEYEVLKYSTPQALNVIETIVGEYHNYDPKKIMYPRSLLYSFVKSIFDDKSKGSEVPTWGSFLFEKRR